jgi:hypothetical protein
MSPHSYSISTQHPFLGLCVLLDRCFLIKNLNIVWHGETIRRQVVSPEQYILFQTTLPRSIDLALFHIFRAMAPK